MDLVHYSPDVFRQIRKQFLSVITSGPEVEISFFPISALEGDNVVNKSLHTLWYTGPTLLSYLENLSLPSNTERPLRLPIQYVIRPDQSFRGFAGQVASGSVQPGDRVRILPSGRQSRIKSLVTYDEHLSIAQKGMSVNVTLEDEVDVGRGDMIVSDVSPPQSSSRFRANVVWLSEARLDPEKTYLIKHTSRMTKCWFTRIHYRVDVEKHPESNALNPSC